jgi:hypothetical protein
MVDAATRPSGAMVDAATRPSGAMVDKLDLIPRYMESAPLWRANPRLLLAAPHHVTVDHCAS